MTATVTPRGPVSVTGPPGRSRRRAGNREEVRTRRLMLLPLTALLSGLTVFPFGYSIWLSLTDRTATSRATHFIGFHNYRDLFLSGRFWHATGLTVAFCLVAVAIELVLGLAVALAVHGMRREHRVLRAVLILPMAATPVAVLFGWKVLLNPSQGAVNYLLGQLHLPQPDWLGRPTMALGTLIGVDVWMWTPFVIIILLGALSSLSHDLIEAAHIDGAGWWGRFKHVILPHLRPYLIIAVLFRGIDSLKVFDSFEVLTAGGPGDATTTLNMFAYKTGLQFLDFGKGAAIATLLLVLAIGFGKLVLRLSERETLA